VVRLTNTLLLTSSFNTLFTKGPYMLRIVLIGVGVVSTALAGYFAKRKFFRPKADGCPVELKVYPPGLRGRSKKGRRTQLDEVLNNGQLDSDDLA